MLEMTFSTSSLLTSKTQILDSMTVRTVLHTVPSYLALCTCRMPSYANIPVLVCISSAGKEISEESDEVGSVPAHTTSVRAGPEP